MIEFSSGDNHIRVLDAGTFGLEGGAKCGVVPQTRRARRRTLHGIEPSNAVELLAPAGLSPEAIDLGVNSDLQFDQGVGSTDIDPGRPAFPRAECQVNRGELATAQWRTERTSGSYLPQDFVPLVAEGRFRLVDGRPAAIPVAEA